MTAPFPGLLPFGRPRLAGWPADFETDHPLPRQPAPRLRASERNTSFWRRQAIRGGLGGLLVLALFGATGLYGTMRNGDYAAFVKANGSPLDLAAKALGFRLDAITLTGEKVLNVHEILDAAGINGTRSLLMLNPAELRDRLKTLPLVHDAVVTKYFPDRLTIAVEEREPVAIWQVDGKLSIVSADGVVIDDMNDRRFIDLPFVVGKGAAGRVAEFLALLDAAGDLRSRVQAGILVGERRWSFKMDNGVEVELPEIGAAQAVAQLVALEKQSKLIDRDIVTLDLRIPGRLTARLSDDAAAARAEMLAKKTKGKGTPE